jgi:anti-sigma-K factor RskA
MTEREDIDMTAAEFVLGTLDASERTSVAARRLREPRLEAAIREWERRLAPLHEVTAEVEPPPGLFAKIEARLDRAGSTESETSGVILQLERRVARWRGLAIAASALAASLVLAIGLREVWYAPRPQNFVAVFQKEDALPSFLLTIDLASRELTIRPVAAERQPGKTYQLWIVAEQLGPAPRSLGLLDEALEPTHKKLTSLDPALLQKATFGISLEPLGGSPTGRPTGPALHGKLYPATP